MAAMIGYRFRDLGPLTLMMMMIIIMVLCGPSVSMAQKESNISRAMPSSLTKVNVGILLDLKTSFGKMGLTCIKMAISDFYTINSHFSTRLVLHTRDSNFDVVSATSSAMDLINNGQVQAIIGPTTSMQSNFVIQLGNKAQVPIITFSATSPSLTSLRSPFFFRFATNDSAQVGAIAAIVKAFGWRQVVPIYVDNEYGDGVIPFLTDALQSVDARVPYRSVIPPSASDDFIAAELRKLTTMSTRVFVVHMLPDLGARVFAEAEKIGMMSTDYAWIVTDGIADFFASANSSFLESMQGVFGVKTYVTRSVRLDRFIARSRTEFRREFPTILDPPMLSVFHLWAYDAAFAVATAVEETSKVVKFSFGRKTESLSVSQSGPKLAEALSRTRFRGISGNLSLVNGQLQVSEFEIMNVIGNGEKRVGFWSVERGLTNSKNKTTTLGTIIWPGGSTTAPKGWGIPTTGKILRVGVPERHGFKEFVQVSYPFSSDTVTGYCIEVFKAVLEEMPYAVPYKFVLFEDAQNRGYNELVEQVHLQNFDAVVGDVTIRANRSSYVDFTLPFTESGVTMIVPIKSDYEIDEWVFWTPLEGNLWLVTFLFFVAIGIVVWILEHRINEDFGGHFLYQIGTGLWYSFSTMVFGHREKVDSTLTRFMVVVWCLVVLILTQSYTASLTSRLTVQRLQPTVTDINILLAKREPIAFHEGSFVKDILKEIGFVDSQFKTYNSSDELQKLFENTTAKGGISAAFDETPYMKLFISKYCNKFAMVEPTFIAEGFGFVFPKGSPLVPDISRAILKVQEGKKMKDIEAKWFKKETNCPDRNNEISSKSLDFKTFQVLFIIVGAVIIFVTVYGLGRFVYKEASRPSDPKASLLKRFLAKETPQIGDRELQFLLKLKHLIVSEIHSARANHDVIVPPVDQPHGEETDPVIAHAQPRERETLPLIAPVQGEEAELAAVGVGAENGLRAQHTAREDDGEIVPARRK